MNNQTEPRVILNNFPSQRIYIETHICSVVADPAKSCCKNKTNCFAANIVKHFGYWKVEENF